VSALPLALRVNEVLLIRIANDLRAAGILAGGGYVLQAAPLIASVFEGTYSIAYIGADGERADCWVNHKDTTRPFVSIRQLVRRVLEGLALTNLENQYGLELDRYSNCAWRSIFIPNYRKGTAW
jgi:hypothetical protein